MERVTSAQRNATRPQHPRLTDLARRELEKHPYFRGRTNDLRIEERGSTLYLSGRLPSFYLKQLVQEALLRLPGVSEIDNAIDVVNPKGVSSVRHVHASWAALPQ